MFGMKVLDDDITKENLEEKYQDESFESNIELLGVTGLEDLLQDNVKESIEQFRDAKIKAWMLTGDKGETAHNIGISCGIIDTQKQ